MFVFPARNLRESKESIEVKVPLYLEERVLQLESRYCMLPQDMGNRKACLYLARLCQLTARSLSGSGLQHHHSCRSSSQKRNGSPENHRDGRWMVDGVDAVFPAPLFANLPKIEPVTKRGGSVEMVDSHWFRCFPELAKPYRSYQQRSKECRISWSWFWRRGTRRGRVHAHACGCGFLSMLCCK